MTYKGTRECHGIDSWLVDFVNQKWILKEQKYDLHLHLNHR